VAQAVVGRSALLDAGWAALAGGGRVLLEGAAGIGKTAVWRALVDRAEAAGSTVLSCAPTESEADLPLAALADVLRPLAPHVDALPPPQRRAVAAVLLSGETDGEVDERALAAGVRTALEAAGERVLVAVDDVQWLDLPSERALRFALRRTAAAVLLARRPAADDPLGLPDLVRLEVPPMGVGELHHLLRERLGTALPRPLLARVARDSGGNPLLALEITRALHRLPRLPRTGEDLPVAASVQELLSQRVAALPGPVRDAVRLAALLAVPTARDLLAAGVDQDALDQAEESGLLVAHPDTVAFAHPLYAATVRSGVPPGVRRGLHRRLADVVADPDERARQLAGATTGPDPDVADELAMAARRHRDRGAPETAAGLWDRAAALHPSSTAAVTHRLAAERARFDSGDYAGAEAGAADLAASCDGPDRAEALLLLGEIRHAADDLDGAVAAALEGLESCPPDSVLAGRIHAHLAVFDVRPEAAGEHARRGSALLSADPAHRPLASATLLMEFYNDLRAGNAPRTELLTRALSLEDPEPSRLAATVPAIYWKAVDDHDLARARLTTLLDQAVARGDEPAQHDLHTHLGEAEISAGRYTAAADHLRLAHDLGTQLGTGLVGENWLLGMVAAHQGNLTEADRVARVGLTEAAATGDIWSARLHHLLAAFTAFSATRPAEAATHYTALAEAVDALGLKEPLSLRFEADWAEACIAAGDLDGATTALARLTARHTRLPRPWTTLGLARVRALLAAARGQDPTPALDALTTARDSIPPAVVPLDRARCLLTTGVVLRRTRKRTAARTALTAAEAEFTTLGATAFTARAQSEAARLGIKPAGGTNTTLTPTETRVAHLAAAGRTNRAIAEELFLSPKTVEANLARIYRKLGITTRAQLGATMTSYPDS